MQTTIRNAELSDLAELLKAQQAHKIDVVAPASAIHAEGGFIRVDNTEVVITDEGVHLGNGLYRPTVVADEGIAEKLSVPVGYLKKLRGERPDLWDANVNGMLHGSAWNPMSTLDFSAEGMSASYLLRLFASGDGDEAGVMRAMLSDRYRRIDYLDTLMAALQGIKDAGVTTEVVKCDLTERRMYVAVAAPEVEVLAPALLKGYHSPFDDASPERARQLEAHGWLRPEKRPVVFAGFVISNSETGGGAFTITPRMIVKACSNGLTMTVDAMRNVHLGGQLQEGTVRWSERTLAKALDLVTSSASDAVATFLDVEYMKMRIDQMEGMAGTKLDKPVETVEVVGKALRFSDEQIAGVLDHFVKAGQTTAGGVMQAVTSYAQVIPDADAAYEMEGMAMRALEAAYRAA